MALPQTGTTYQAALQPTINPLGIREGVVVDVLVRDYLRTDGTVNNLADPSVGLNTNGQFSPFAADGTLRSDLLGPSGLGFYHVGGLNVDGIEMKSDTQTKDTYIAQSLRPVRIDVTQDADTIHIKCDESSPLVDALRFDKPLSSLQDYGSAGYSLAKDAETQLIERQFIALGFDGENLFSMTYPRMALKERGTTSWKRGEVDVTDITFGALLCPYVQSPVLLSRDGAAWRGLQGAPVFGAVAPVATAVSGQKATVAFAAATSVNTFATSSQYTYTVQKSSDGGTTWTSATVVSTTGTTNLTITLSGITSSLNWIFKVTAVGSAQISTTSAASNSIIGLT